MYQNIATSKIMASQLPYTEPHKLVPMGPTFDDANRDGPQFDPGRNHVFAQVGLEDWLTSSLSPFVASLSRQRLE